MPEEAAEKRIAELAKRLDWRTYSNREREEAVEQLGQFGEKALPHLLKAMADHCHRVSGLALDLVSKQGPASIPHVVEALNHFDPEVSDAAAGHLYWLAKNLWNYPSQLPSNTPEQKALRELFFSIRERRTPPSVFYKAFMAVKEGQFKNLGEQENFVEKLRREHEEAMWRFRNRPKPQP